MLAKKEKALMKVIYNEAVKNEGKCLIRPTDILKSIPYKLDFTRQDLAANLRGLALDDYYELIETEKKGEEIYCFTLHQNGYAFIREIQSEKRMIKFKIILTIAGSIGAFLLGRLLSLI